MAAENWAGVPRLEQRSLPYEERNLGRILPYEERNVGRTRQLDVATIAEVCAVPGLGPRILTAFIVAVPARPLGV